MPNYCNNTLEVSVDPKDREALKQFENFVKTSLVEWKEDGEMRFTFDGVVPMPKELDIPSRFPKSDELEALEKANIEKYGHPNWYDWRCEKWGTKWDAVDTYINSEPYLDYIMVSFDTAWSPPIPYYEALSKKYPLLSISVEYGECGMDFAGIAKYEGGELISSEETTYSLYEFTNDNDYWWENMEYALEDGSWTLEEFKDMCSDVWAVMDEKDRKDLVNLFKQSESA